jgi:hypothetical protein
LCIIDGLGGWLRKSDYMLVDWSAELIEPIFLTLSIATAIQNQK